MVDHIHGCCATQMVVSFHFWIDLLVESRISYAGQPMGLTGYEKSAAAFVFISFLLSVGATVFAMKVSPSAVAPCCQGAGMERLCWPAAFACCVVWGRMFLYHFCVHSVVCQPGMQVLHDVVH
jgi:hypothetical protein